MGVVGACMVPFAYQCFLMMTSLEFGFLIAGWLLYLVAILTYSQQWLNLWPSVFGYHEIFHLLTIIGGCCTGVFNYSMCVRVQ
jgi:hemolysin III